LLGPLISRLSVRTGEHPVDPLRCSAAHDLRQRREEIVLFPVQIQYKHRLVFHYLARESRVPLPHKDARDGIPERLSAAYSCPWPWPGYLKGVEWSTCASAPPRGWSCSGSHVLCSSPAMCLLPHHAQLRIDPTTLTVHARLARVHAAPAATLSWGTVDPWRFAVTRMVVHNPRTLQSGDRLEEAWPHVVQRMPEGSDPLVFALHKSEAVLVVVYNDWFLALKQMHEVPQTVSIHQVCSRASKFVVALFVRCMRSAREHERAGVARIGSAIASFVVQSMCVLPEAPCRPWMARLVKLLRAQTPQAGSAGLTLAWAVERRVPLAEAFQAWEATLVFLLRAASQTQTCASRVAREVQHADRTWASELWDPTFVHINLLVSQAVPALRISSVTFDQRWPFHCLPRGRPPVPHLPWGGMALANMIRTRWCGACGGVKRRLRRCGGCRVRFYCSKRCQKWDWNKQGHGIVCLGMA